MIFYFSEAHKNSLYIESANGGHLGFYEGIKVILKLGI